MKDRPDYVVAFARLRVLELLEDAGPAGLTTTELREQLEHEERKARCTCRCGDSHTRPRRRWIRIIGPVLLEPLEDEGIIERAEPVQGPGRVRHWRATSPVVL